MKCCRYIVAVVGAVLHERTVPLPPEGISWKQVYEMAKYQGLESMVFAGVQTRLEKDGKQYQKWESRYARNLIQCFTQEEELDTILRKFCRAGINVILLKGDIIRELYPQKDFRQMADLDILVRDRDRAEAGKILRQLGYQYLPDPYDHQDDYQKPPYMCVELHRSLVQGDCAYKEYGRDIWERVIPVEGRQGCFRMDINDYYVFHLIHFAKHYFAKGSGIRSVLDIYIFLQKYGKELDREYLEEWMKRLGLQEFQRTAEMLAEYWFGRTKVKLGKAAPDMERKVFFSGTYGSKLSEVLWQAEEYRTKKYGAAHYIFSRVFMNRKAMAADYPCLKRRPFLLPLCWIHRLVKTVLTNYRTISYEIITLLRR